MVGRMSTWSSSCPPLHGTEEKWFLEPKRRNTYPTKRKWRRNSTCGIRAMSTTVADGIGAMEIYPPPKQLTRASLLCGHINGIAGAPKELHTHTTTSVPKSKRERPSSDILQACVRDLSVIDNAFVGWPGLCEPFFPIPAPHEELASLLHSPKEEGKRGAGFPQAAAQWQQK